MDRREAEERAEKAAKQAQALMMQNARQGRKTQAKMQLLEEEERKRKEEEDKKMQQDEAKKQAQAKEFEKKGQTSLRQIQQAETEKLRAEVRAKITQKI